MSAADLDALDRGVLEAGQAAAEALSRICALEAEVARLAKRCDARARAEEIITGRPALRPRPRHLRRIQ